MWLWPKSKEIKSNVTLVSTIGKDLDGKVIEKILKKKKLKHHLKKISIGKSIKKLRIFSEHHQMIRLDFESERKSYELKLDIKLKNEIDKSKLILLSDYGKGALLEIRKIIKYAKGKSKIIIIDPKGSDFNKYKHASILTPNMNEFIEVVGEVNNKTQLVKKARNLIQKNNLVGVLVTQGKNGMTFVTKDKVIHKDSLTQSVYDVTGAGDTVIATFAAYLNLGKTYEESMEMANIAASMVIKKIGTATVNKKEIEEIYENKNKILNKKFYTSNSEILKKIQTVRSKNMKIVMTNGCFDIVHAGHIHLLENAKKLGDFMIVAINSDKSVKELKGKKRPVNKLSARIEMLQALSCVDLVVVFNELTPLKTIKMISPDVLVKGGDYKIKDIVGADLVITKKGKVRIIKTKKGYSTTKILLSQNI
ncbi:D-glycero-beta-D-manno-heptose 1-phosphate adenylyltransferase [Candidatus Pelagibacter sp.]|nr:D-glycero-beta-D-manno-heptose 1-phosphate adenylyltransferase [Candidatus Pelagibacter sp.]